MPRDSSKLSCVFNHIIMPAERALQRIEDYGAYVDYDRLMQVTKDYSHKLEDTQWDLNKHLPASVDWDVNWNSPQQVAEVLFKHLKLPVQGKTDTGQPQTGKSTLLHLVEYHPLPGLLLEVRKYSKALSGFLEPWKMYLDYEIAHGRPPRLHTTYNIAKTNTGRLSAEDPNLQQVARDKAIRSLISAPPGYVVIEADYSQIELRIAAFIAQALSMLRIYASGGDVHLRTAMNISGKKAEDVTKEIRTRAKAVNFGFIYGMWWRTFKTYAFDSYGVTVSDKEAEAFRTAFFSLFPELVPWHDNSKQYARHHKCIKSPLGRVRYLPNIDSPDKELRGKAERQAINTPVQSMASDMLLLALIVVDRWLEGQDAHIIGEVHDAMLIECREDQAKHIGATVKYLMESVPTTLERIFDVHLNVPIIADVTIGKGWGAGVDLAEFKAS